MAWLFLSIPTIGTILCIIHIIKTNRDRSWIYIMIFLPGAGAIAYFLVEILPDLLGTRTGREIKKTIVRVATGSSRIRRLQHEVKLSDTFEKKKALAEAYREAGSFDLAIPVYRDCLSGVFKDNVEVKFRLAGCLFHVNSFEEADSILQTIDNVEGRLKQAAITLLHAQVLEVLGRNEKAEQLFQQAAPSFPGFEGYARYARFLNTTGKHEKAIEQWKAIVDMSITLPSPNRRIERKWISEARKEVNVDR